ncbi:GTPase [Massilia sp. TS11]|uniref:GTPase n=1 Tax=Massilia sp. TS11 TaxID=2908003 RepID=UPI001EDB26AD|nr:GTPase [Massilia sp. TS11]MCG2585469.1 GTPase [Massilia sp. TS11]
MTETTLVWGGTAAAREAAIAAAADGEDGVAILIEGLASGQVELPSATRVAAGCLCCAGQLVLQVSLNRILRQAPRRLFLGLASGEEHVGRLRAWLQSAPYAAHLHLTPDLVCP